MRRPRSRGLLRFAVLCLLLIIIFTLSVSALMFSWDYYSPNNYSCPFIGPGSSVIDVGLPIDLVNSAGGIQRTGFTALSQFVLSESPVFPNYLILGRETGNIVGIFFLSDDAVASASGNVLRVNASIIRCFGHQNGRIVEVSIDTSLEIMFAPGNNIAPIVHNLNGTNGLPFNSSNPLISDNIYFNQSSWNVYNSPVFSWYDLYFTLMSQSGGDMSSADKTFISSIITTMQTTLLSQSFDSLQVHSSSFAFVRDLIMEVWNSLGAFQSVFIISIMVIIFLSFLGGPGVYLYT